MQRLRVLTMLNVNVLRDRFTMIGHADYAKRGEDIVCSACSAVMLFAVDMLEVYSPVKAQIDEGNVSVKILNPNAQTEEVMETFLFYMKKMQATYPKHVKVFGGIQ